MYPIYNHNWGNISTIYAYNKTSIKRNILIIKKIHRKLGRAKDLWAPRYTACCKNTNIQWYRIFLSPIVHQQIIVQIVNFSL